MRWPLMWKATHDAQVAVAATNFQNALHERTYWQNRAEKLLDHALFKRGEITSPVFQDSPTAKSTDIGSRLFEALRVTEIDTLQRPAVPVTPMR